MLQSHSNAEFPVELVLYSAALHDLDRMHLSGGLGTCQLDLAEPPTTYMYTTRMDMNMQKYMHMHVHACTPGTHTHMYVCKSLCSCQQT